MASKPAYVWDGSAWQQIGPVVNSPIKFQTTAPASPSTGDVWVDSDGALDSLITNTGDFVSQSAFNSSVSSLSSSKANISGQVYTGTHNFTGAALSGAGLDLITSQSFSSVTSVNFNNCFSSSYENYRIIAAVNGAAVSQTLTIRLRASGVDNSGSNYHQGIAYLVYNNASVVTAANSINQTSWFGWGLTSALTSIVQSIDLYRPFLSVPTGIVSNYAKGPDVGSDAGIGNGVHTASSSFDGFSFLMSSSTMTGSIRVYGYRNA